MFQTLECRRQTRAQICQAWSRRQWFGLWCVFSYNLSNIMFFSHPQKPQHPSQNVASIAAWTAKAASGVSATAVTDPQPPAPQQAVAKSVAAAAPSDFSFSARARQPPRVVCPFFFFFFFFAVCLPEMNSGCHNRWSRSTCFLRSF
jgi:hypothetical protein